MRNTNQTTETRTSGHILVTTLGTSWCVVPELLGFVQPDTLDLYAHSPQRDEFRQQARKYGFAPLDELWIATTMSQSVAMLHTWHARLDQAPRLRIWRLACPDLTTPEQCHAMADLIYRMVFHAAQRCQTGQLLLSLAGGRKTMSAAMQEAGRIFGCSAMLHVLLNGPKLDDDYTLYIRPLAAETVTRLHPMVTAGSSEPDLALTVPYALDPRQYPLPETQGNQTIVQPDTTLYTEIHRRLDTAGNVMVNYTRNIMDDRATSNFRALYALHPTQIKTLQEQFIGRDPTDEDQDLDWLRKLPKPELHCHLGGIADPADMVAIALTVRQEVAELRRHHPGFNQWLAEMERAVAQGDADRLKREAQPKPLRTRFKGVPEPYAVCGLLSCFQQRPQLLETLIYQDMADQRRFKGVGITRYEALGDFQGSGLLQCEATLRATCRLLLEKATAHHVRLLEVRCSPRNYTRGDLHAEQVVRILRDAFMRDAAADRMYIRLLFIASRHRSNEEMQAHITLAQRFMDEEDDMQTWFGGFDLAGDESQGDPEKIRRRFLPLMKECLHLTIHAGETCPAESIWNAVYQLHAERIGHGLTLREHPRLMRHLSERGIAIEMCPSSNDQIAGFRDFAQEEGVEGAYNEYPLKHYLDNGLKVTVNTDNPGISRTDFSREYYKAARLTKGGLSRWDILRLIRNGFRAGFLAQQTRRKLLLDAEKEMWACICS